MSFEFEETGKKGVKNYTTLHHQPKYLISTLGIDPFHVRTLNPPELVIKTLSEAKRYMAKCAPHHKNTVTMN